MAWSSNNNRPPSAAGGGFAAAVVVAGPGQGKAGKAGETGPGQTKPRLGTTGKPAKPRQSDHVISPGKKIAIFSVSKLILVSRLVISRDSRLATFSTMLKAPWALGPTGPLEPQAPWALGPIGHLGP